MSNPYIPSAPPAAPQMIPMADIQRQHYPPAYAPVQVYPGQGLPPPTVPVNSFFWGKNSQVTTCPFCRNMGATVTRYESGCFTWASCIGLSLLGLNLGCCLIPFCVDEFKDTYHYCQVCNTLLGMRKPLS